VSEARQRVFAPLHVTVGIFIVNNNPETMALVSATIDLHDGCAHGSCLNLNKAG
jgi:hypothetical protein